MYMDTTKVIVSLLHVDDFYPLAVWLPGLHCHIQVVFTV